MKLKFNVTRYAICVPISNRQWNKLQKLDDKDYGETVHKTLEAAGAIRGTIEFNGHFGSNVFCWVESMDDATRFTTGLESLLAPRKRNKKN